MTLAGTVSRVCHHRGVHLKIAFPGAAGLFAAVDSPFQPGFPGLLRLQDARTGLAQAACRWLSRQGYCRPQGRPPNCTPPWS